MSLEPAKIWENAILFWSPADSPITSEDAYLNRIIIQISLTLGLLVFGVAISMPILTITAEGTKAGGIFCVSILFGVLASLTLLRASGKRLIAINVLLIVIWGIMFISCFFLGGLKSPSIILLILVPILASTIGRRYWATGWAICVIASWLVLLILSKTGHQFTQIIVPQHYQIAVLINLAVACIVIVTIVSIYAEINQNLRLALENNNKTLRHLAGHDPLTNLANRRSYYEQLDLAIRRANHQSTCFALLTIDLNDFKEVNDTYGHSAGDQILLSIATRLKKTIRHSDFVARLGGDEFVVIMEQVVSKDDVTDVANKLASCIKQPIESEEIAVILSASIGIAIYPDHGQDLDSLQESSDRAMYLAKAQAVGYLYADA